MHVMFCVFKDEAVTSALEEFGLVWPLSALSIEKKQRNQGFILKKALILLFVYVLVDFVRRVVVYHKFLTLFL